MSSETAPVADVTQSFQRAKEWRHFRRVFFGRKVVVFGIIVIMVFLLVAIFAPFIAPYHPNEQNLVNTLAQPSKKYLLGTDPLGRDTLSRIIYGSRTSLMIGLVVVALGSFIGMSLGLIAGYFGGWTYNIIMRFIDALMSFPMILFALVIVGGLGSGTKNVIIALSIAMMPGYARLMCGQVLSAKENDYVLASRSIGSSNMRIMMSDIVPNCFPPLIVMIAMMLGNIILAEAGLSFLGIGVIPPTATWGSMVSDGQRYLLSNPILSFAPGVALMLIVFAFNMVGDGLRDALDPRLRGTF